MIETLEISNLILVERAKIIFGPGLNILTGETGSGKSAILSAIRLLLGERADAQLIRQGADLAIIEASLKIPHSSLPDLDLPPPDAPIRIRREIHRSGRSRCFIEDSLVTLQQLKQVVGHSIELVDQSSSIQLSESEEQRYLLDSFACIHADVSRLSHSFTAQQQAEEELNHLLQMQQNGAREQEKAEEDLALIEEINWQSGEEEKLNAEHHLLTHSQELLDKIGAVTGLLLEGPQPVSPAIKRLAYQLEQLLSIEPKLQEAVTLLKTGALELEEAGGILLSYVDRLDADPNRITAIEERIGLIESLKKRFGSSFEQVMSTRDQLKKQVNRLSNLDEEIGLARTKWAELQASNILQASKITQKRERAAIALSTATMSELKHLNLAHAAFVIHLEPKPLSPNGANHISFRFAANPGQPLLPLTECASGGELSRLLFALKTALADKEESSCLIFDEIDSNVGGKTAAILGTKLQALAASRQLICVTHFVQVAQCAMHHFLVSKQTKSTGAYTTIHKMDPKEREVEFARMTGKEPA